MIKPNIQILDLNKKNDLSIYQRLCTASGITIVDHYLEQLYDLFEVRFPHNKANHEEKKRFVEGHLHETSLEKTGVWVFYPWRNTLVHLLSESDFFELRTARNFPLVSKEDQQKLYNSSIGVVGLSVGNSILLSLVYSGIARKIKIADYDSVMPSNLNRLRASVCDIGTNKCHLAAQQIYEANPFCKVEIFDEGLHAHNLKQFFLEQDKPELIIDECDNLALKFYLRIVARSLRIPLMMVTDNGYTVTISSLDFKNNPNAGGMAEAPEVDFESIEEGLRVLEPVELTDHDKILLIDELLGKKDIKPEMKHATLLKADQKIAGFPQLGAVASIAGGLGVLVIKQLLLTENKLPESISIHFDDLLALHLYTPAQKKVIEKNYSDLLERLLHSK